jgi:hypothetical protein
VLSIEPPSAFICLVLSVRVSPSAASLEVSVSVTLPLAFATSFPCVGVNRLPGGDSAHVARVILPIDLEFVSDAGRGGLRKVNKLVMTSVRMAPPAKPRW